MTRRRSCLADLAIVHRSGAILYRKGALLEERDLGLPWREPNESPTFGVADAPARAEPEISHCVPSEERELLLTVIEQAGKARADAVPDEALTLYEQGHYSAAADQLTALLTQSPENVQATALLARVHANQGNLVEALAWCDKAIVLQKMNPGMHYLRATILQEQGALDEAVRTLQRILYLDPNFALAHFTLGTVALQFGRFEASDKHFENTRYRCWQPIRRQKSYPSRVELPPAGSRKSSRGLRLERRFSERQKQWRCPAPTTNGCGLESGPSPYGSVRVGGRAAVLAARAG